MNQQPLPNSPSLQPDLLNIQQKSPKGFSDVQSRVAFLNNLARGDTPTPGQHSSPGGHTAALQRAILGREEAESALANASVQLLEAQSRERRISERLESLLEELHSAKERQTHERGVFEKEIRKARKEAFRAGSTLVKLQEELKHSRTEIKGLRDEILAERAEKEKAKQEAFERDYALASMTEDLEVLKGRLRSVETNNHSNALEAQAQRMSKSDLGRLSLAEGDLAFLTTPRKSKRSAEDSVDSPFLDTSNRSGSDNTPQKKPRLSDSTPQAESPDITTIESLNATIKDLNDQLSYEKWIRADCEGMIEFMKIECQFKACSCRLAEAQGTEYVYDVEYDKRMKAKAAAEKAKEAEQARPPKVRATNNARPPPSRAAPIPPPHSTAYTEEPIRGGNKREAVEEPLIAFSPMTGTFKTIPSPVRDSALPDGEPMIISEPVGSRGEARAQSIDQPPFPAGSESKARNHSPVFAASESSSSLKDHFSATAGVANMRITPDLPGEQYASRYASANEYCTTKRVPLRDDSSPSDQFSVVPGTPISREDALAQIRARRGRAQSTKRSASASEATVRSARFGAAPVRDAKRIPGFHHQTGPRSEGDTSERRDLSAPVRMFRR